MGVGGVVVILLIGGQESADRRFGDPSASATSSTGDPGGPGTTNSTRGHGGPAADEPSTYRPTVLSRVPHIPDATPNAQWPNIGFSPVPIGKDLGWGSADAEPGSSAGASWTGRSSPTIPGLPIVLVGVAALLGVRRAVVHRRQAPPSHAEAADATPPPSIHSATEDTRPPNDIEAAVPRDGADPAAVAGTGAAAAAADPRVDSPGPASPSPISARSAAAPASARRPPDRVTLGSGTAVLPTEARSRVQLYAKPAWGPR
jgi:hypothetical protein